MSNIKQHLYCLATDEYRGIFASLVKVALYILSLIYGFFVHLLMFINRLKPVKLGVTVISVGNITMGGTGKTPLVEYITKYLKNCGRKVAILSRGYKIPQVTGKALGPSGRLPKADEPSMLEEKLHGVNVIVGANRKLSSEKAIKQGADIVVLDDALQQWGIIKDIEIVVIDATDPFGNRHLIPRGILRQPLSSLKNADVFVITKTNLNPDFQDINAFLKELNPCALIVESSHSPCGFIKLGQTGAIIAADAFKGKTVALFCGIGDPDSFDALISSLGMKIGLSFKFCDHHEYSFNDLNNIILSARNKNIDTIITTEKDAARLSGYTLSGIMPEAGDLSFFALRIELKINKNEERFLDRLAKLPSV